MNYENVFRLLCLAAVSSSLAWQSLAVLCGECMGLRAHFSTAKNSDIHAPVVLQWFFTSGAKGEFSLKQSAGTAKYFDELSFLRVTRT